MQTVLAIFLAVGAAASAPAAKQAPARESYGLAGGREQVGCVLTHRKITRFPLPITIVTPQPGYDASPPLRGQVVSALSKPCKSLTSASVDPDEPAAKAYAVRLDMASWQEGSWSGMVAFDAAAPGSLRACNSMEGIHLTAWKGKPLRSARLWHGYFWFDYEVESGGPSECRERDYAE
ncbi:hypothetical protein [Lysobacter sp. ESA13C]|uniref:hypothetical protein n=1 Tax=Lysobacter sp. ESA13C TaxID=2862676 RepID=UPI001CC085D9|nr:hypothetical protein [Lysobacter sp. ESA13C]